MLINFSVIEKMNNQQQCSFIYFIAQEVSTAKIMPIIDDIFNKCKNSRIKYSIGLNVERQDTSTMNYAFFSHQYAEIQFNELGKSRLICVCNEILDEINEIEKNYIGLLFYFNVYNIR